MRGKKISRNRRKVIDIARLVKDLEEFDNRISKLQNKISYNSLLTDEDRVGVNLLLLENEGLLFSITYDIEIDGNWISIKIFENMHDPTIIHLHTRKNLQSSVVFKTPIRMVGDPKDLLDWVKSKIYFKWYSYRRKFFARSKVVDN